MRDFLARVMAQRNMEQTSAAFEPDNREVACIDCGEVRQVKAGYSLRCFRCNQLIRKREGREAQAAQAGKNPPKRRRSRRPSLLQAQPQCV